MKGRLSPFFSPSVLVFLTFWLFVLLSGRSAMFQDPGTFWHTVLGEKMLNDQEFVRQDWMSYTFAGRPWLAQQWVGDVTMAIGHRWAGWDALLVLAATALAGLYTWTAWRYFRNGLDPILTVVVLMLILAATSHHFHVRPHLMTIGALALVVACLSGVEHERWSVTRLYVLTPLFVVWANTHGGVLAGLATVCLVGGGWTFAWLIGWPGPLRSATDVAHLAAVALLGAASIWVNPYGAEMPRAWATILTMDLPRMIQEHSPLDPASGEFWAVVALAGLYLRVLSATRPFRPRVLWLLPGVWLALAFSRVRHAPLFAVVTTIILADLLPRSGVYAWLVGRDLARVPESQQQSFFHWRSAVVPLLVIVTTLGVQRIGWTVPVVGRGWVRHDPTRWPTGLLPELQAIEASSPDPVPILNSLNFGGFLEFHTPRLRPFIDDRCELFGKDFLGDYVEAESHAPERIDRWSDTHRIDWALVHRNGLFDGHLAKSSRWRLVRRDAAAALYERRPAETTR